MNNRKAFIPISALLGALLLALVATMTPFVADPDRAHAQSAASITVGGKAVSGFAVGTFDYTANPTRVSSGTTHIQVNASAVSGSRVHSIRYAPDITPSSTAGSVSDFTTLPGQVASGGNVPLRSNESTDIGVVIATGSGATATGTIYVVTVTRVSSGASDNANLAATTGLAIGGVPTGTTLVPDYDPDTTSYSLFVPYDVNDSGNDATNTITVTPTLADDTDPQTTTAGASFTIASNKDSELAESGGAYTVELAEGANVITISVEAANVVTKKTYTVTVTRARANSSDDARLSSLTVGGKSVPAANIELADGADGLVDYTTRFPFATESVQVTAVKNHAGAQVLVRTGDAAAASVTGTIDTDGRVSLTAGTPLFIAVQVTAQDGTSASRRNYILQVTRVAQDAASDANLAASDGLTLTNPAVALAPAYNQDTTSYTAFVPYDVDGATPVTVNDEVTVTPTLSDTTAAPANASFTITSNRDSEIGSDNIVELAVGANVISVVVEAADVVTKKTYTVTVTRAAETGSDDATLSALTVGGESVSVSGFTSTASPSADDVDYTTNVPTTVQRVLVAATPTDSSAVVVIRSGADVSAALTNPIDTDGRIDLTAGAAVFITVQVTAADGETVNNYILSVTRASPTASSTANLTNLTITAPTGITVAPTFGEDVTSYTASVPHDVDANTDSPTAGTQDEITLTLPLATGATIEVTSDMDDAIATTTTPNEHVVELAEGANVITIMVEAEDAVATKTYTLTVTRATQSTSDDASLSSLMVGSETVSLPLPEFDSTSAATISASTYATGVSNIMNSIQIDATPTHAGAMAVIRTGATAEAAATGSIDADGNIPLIVGYTNFIAVQVMAEDGLSASNKTYMLQVNRAPAGASSDAKLIETGGLTISTGILMPDYDQDTMAYTAEVGNAVGSVTVTATGFGDNTTVTDNNRATVRIMSDRDDEIGNNLDTTGVRNLTSHAIDLMVGANVITVMVTASDYVAMNTYTVTITRESAGDDASLASLGLKHLPMNMMEGVAIELMPAFDSGTMTYTADAGSAEAITVTPKTTNSDASVSVTVNGIAAMKTDIPMYWDMLGCPAMNDSVRAYDDHSHPDNATSPYCTTYNADATHPGLMGDAKDVVDMTFANYYDVPLSVGDNAVAVMVTSEDETETETYTVTVTRVDMSDEARLLAEYDANSDDVIDDGEMNTAIGAYLDGMLSDADMNTLIGIYLGG
ncbi:MAG: cadherin-like beta sandwich domain-containing protein [Chloroflexi bacterium]|nr:cadherin-like beta sandwich domain-containing protein [Chloroflexota bacterium]